MQRATCSLPKALRSFCESGCIYREKNFTHIRCPQVLKTDLCAAPCKKPCPCPAPPSQKNHKYYHEVCEVQQTCRRQLHM